jgi:hypothetical protein
MRQLGFDNTNKSKNLNDLKRLITADPRTGKERTGKKATKISFEMLGRKNGEFREKSRRYISFVYISFLCSNCIYYPCCLSLLRFFSERRNGNFFAAFNGARVFSSLAGMPS